MIDSISHFRNSSTSELSSMYFSYSTISLNDPIDTTTAQGKFAFNIFASLAEFERDMIIIRTKAGLSAAVARGRKGDRPKGIKQTRYVYLNKALLL